MNGQVTEADMSFLNAFRAGDLPLSDFTHEAHLRLAWIHLALASLPEAIDGICKEIQQFVVIHGKQDKYHHTLTVAAMHVLARRMGAPDSRELRNFPTFLIDNPDLLTNLKALISKHYSPERLSLPEARTGWLAPDLQEF